MSLFNSFLTDTSRLLDHPANPRLQGMIDSVVSSTIRSTPRLQPNLENIASGRYVIPPDETYSARYSSGTSTYYYYYDEAIRNSTANALAMRRDTAISEPLDHRKMACVSQNWYLKPDDPDDADQQAVCDDLESVLENASMFKQFLLNLLEDIYFGKAGCQSKFGYETIKGKKRLTVIDHAPIMGDKIQYHYNGTPGILIRGGSPYLDQPEYAKNIDRSTLGPALFLNDPWLRDQFVISKFRTSDFDYIWEGDKALAVHGIGMRDSLYWAWNLRTEVWTWILDALQRVSANGMTIGFFEYGNAQAESEMMKVMKQLVKDNYAVVGVDKGTDPQNMIHNIPVSAVGYEVMINIVKYLDDFIRRAFLGQELTSTSRSSGMGSETANIQKSAFDHIVGYDSDRIAETISRQLLKTLLKYNTWIYKKQEVYGDQLPFSIRFMFEDRDDEDAKPADTAKTLHEIGIPLDVEDIQDKTGFAAPRDRESMLPGKSQEEPASPMATQGKGVPVPPNGQAAQRPTFPANGMTPGKNGKNLGRIDQMEMFNESKTGDHLDGSSGDGDSPELFQSNRILGVHAGFSKNQSGSYEPEILRSNVVNGLANQYDRIANPADPNRESPDRLVSSDKFYLMKIPVDLAVPSKRVEPGSRSYSSGPIVIDRNIRGVGSNLKAMGYDPSIMILDGKHRHAEAMKNGDRQMFAYVGDQVIDRVQSRIMADRQSAARRLERLQASIPVDAPNPDPAEDEGVYIGMEVPRETVASLPLSLGSTGGDAVPPHVTLAYIGKRMDMDSNQIKILGEICSLIASQTPRLRGQVRGTERFPATESSDNKEVAYAGVHVDGLADMRQDLVDILDLYEIPYSNTFAFTPHITLEYVEQGEDIPDLNFDPVVVRFDSLYFSVGKDMKNYYFK